MTKLFVYGTLQQPEVQLELLGRFIDGEVDSIENYIVVRDYVDPEDGIAYPRIKQYENGCTFGKILDVSDDELEILDKYETDMYQKKVIITKSQKKVLIYFPVKLD
jgi:gamma-glutamylcyclotransferase (GGCT)/AIG2-like uncharacterized protein YtfP